MKESVEDTGPTLQPVAQTGNKAVTSSIDPGSNQTTTDPIPDFRNLARCQTLSARHFPNLVQAEMESLHLHSNFADLGGMPSQTPD